jgi:hypothetical protein
MIGRSDEEGVDIKGFETKSSDHDYVVNSTEERAQIMG